MNGIYFPGLGISLPNVPDGFTIFGVNIKFYGLIIAIGFVLALRTAIKDGKRTGIKEDDYLDYWLWMLIPCILGARIYYILFNLKEYVGEGISFGESLRRMIDIRNGGLGIYGGLIAGVIVSVIFTRKRKISLPLFADNIAAGVLIGQIMGRWGNFFNREVFGSYTSAFFRMAIPVDYFSQNGMLSTHVSNGVITDQMLQNTEMVNGVECITVVPSFLLEGLWNLAVLIFILWYRKRKKFDGEQAMFYILLYGIGRFLIEGNRTDSLMIGPLKVSQVVAVLCIVTGLAVLIRNYMKIRSGHPLPCHRINDPQPEGEKQEEAKQQGSKKKTKLITVGKPGTSEPGKTNEPERTNDSEGTNDSEKTNDPTKAVNSNKSEKTEKSENDENARGSEVEEKGIGDSASEQPEAEKEGK